MAASVRVGVPGIRGRPCAQLAPRPQRRARVQVAASMCPYSTLGVTAGANDNEIKAAYRKLVLQYHPDVNPAQGAERRFMSIQQAYELLSGKARGPGGADGPSGRRSDWAFHDWYWSFMQKRRWSSYKGAAARSSSGSGPRGPAADANSQHDQQHAAPPPHTAPEHAATLRSQLAGLRHRAAIRATKRRNSHAGVAADGAQQQQQQEGEPGAAAADGGGLEYDSSAMSDGVNLASGVTDWAAAAGRRRFSATESHRQQVASQVAGLHRRAEASGGLW